MIFLDSIRRFSPRRPIPALKPTIYYVRSCTRPGFVPNALDRLGGPRAASVACIAGGAGAGGRRRSSRCRWRPAPGARESSRCLTSGSGAPGYSRWTRARYSIRRPAPAWASGRSIPTWAASSAAPTATRATPTATPSNAPSGGTVSVEGGGAAALARIREAHPGQDRRCRAAGQDSRSFEAGRRFAGDRHRHRSVSAGGAHLPAHPQGPRGAHGFRGLRIGIISKSPLVTRDIDVLQRLSERNEVTVNVSIATLDPRLLAGSSCGRRCRPPGSAGSRD